MSRCGHQLKTEVSSLISLSGQEVAQLANKYTIPNAGTGWCQCGLLFVQYDSRPELFGACLPAVGVMDMLRLQKFTAGRF